MNDVERVEDMLRMRLGAAQRHGVAIDDRPDNWVDFDAAGKPIRCCAIGAALLFRARPVAVRDEATALRLPPGAVAGIATGFSRFPADGDVESVWHKLGAKLVDEFVPRATR